MSARRPSLLVGVPVAMFVLGAWQLRWMSDDGYIHLRVVQNLLAGNGPVFNAGERVEASTSPLWVLLLGTLDVLLPLSLPWIAVVAGVVLSGIGLVAAGQAAQTHCGRDRVVVPVGIIIVAALLPMREFATSGMETGLSFGWLGMCCWWCAHRPRAQVPPRARIELMTAGLISLGWLIRPDFAIFSVAFAAVHLASVWTSARRRVLPSIAALLALPLAYQLFRMGYYAMLVPNTSLAKEAGVAQWDLGWAYLVDLVTTYHLWAALIAVLALQVLGQLRGRRWLLIAAQLAPTVAGIVHAAVIIRLGGDFMHARLLLPAVFAIVAPTGMTLARRGVSKLAPAAALAAWLVVVVMLRPPVPVYPEDTSHGNRLIHERRLWLAYWDAADPVEPSYAKEYYEDARPPVGSAVFTFPESEERDLGVPLASSINLDAARAVIRAGATSYLWGPEIYAIDLIGLGHPVGGHLEGLVGRHIGHQKQLPIEWMAAVASGSSEVRASNHKLLASAPHIGAARVALGCGQLGRYLGDISSPLTPEQIARNMVDSIANTTFRIPREPAVAERQLCGDSPASIQ